MKRITVTVLVLLGLASPVLAEDAGVVTVPAFVAPDAFLDAGPVVGTPAYMAPEQPSPTATPSPTTTAPTPPVIVTIDEAGGWKLVEQYGPIAGIGFLLFLVLSKFLERNKSEHWLAQGRVLAILAGLAMLGAAVLEWLANGGQAAGVPVMAVLVKALFMMPTSGPRPAGGA